MKPLSTPCAAGKTSELNKFLFELAVYICMVAQRWRNVK